MPLVTWLIGIILTTFFYLVVSPGLTERIKTNE